MTIVSTATLSEGLDADVFCLLTSLPLRNRVLAIKKKKKNLKIPSFFPPFLFLPSSINMTHHWSVG